MGFIRADHVAPAVGFADAVAAALKALGVELKSEAHSTLVQLGIGIQAANPGSVTLSVGRDSVVDAVFQSASGLSVTGQVGR